MAPIRGTQGHHGTVHESSHHKRHREAREYSRHKHKHQRELAEQNAKTRQEFGAVSIGPVSNSLTVIGERHHHKISHKAKWLKPTALYQNGAFQVTALQGQQGYAIGYQLSNTPGNALTGLPFPIYNDVGPMFSDYNWNAGTYTANAPALVPSTEYGTGTGEQYNLRNIIIKTIHWHYMLANNSNSIAFLKIYDFTWKNAKNWRYTKSDQAMNNVDTLWDAGFNLLNSTTTDGKLYNRIGTSPMESPYVKKCYHLEKMTEVVLSPGSVHTHTVDHHFYKKMNGLVVSNNVSGLDPIPGAYCTLIVMYGAPCHSIPTGTTATIAPTWIDVAWTRKITMAPYMSVANIPARYDEVANDLMPGGTGATGSITTPGTVNIEKGTGEAAAKA